jgi:hypothetical protein
MKHWLLNNWLFIAGAMVGAVAGFLYWKLIGCSTGTCAITSKPVNSTVYFSVMGALLFGIFKREKKKAGTKEL